MNPSNKPILNKAPLPDATKVISKGSIFISASIAIVILLLAFNNFAKGYTLFSLFLVLCACFFVLCTLSSIRTYKRYKNYYQLITQENIYSLDKLATINNVSYATVVDDLKQMIAYDYLQYSMIDETTRELVIDCAAEFICKTCGATNSVAANHKKTCEYCGNQQK